MAYVSPGEYACEYRLIGAMAFMSAKHRESVPMLRRLIENVREKEQATNFTPRSFEGFCLREQLDHADRIVIGYVGFCSEHVIVIHASDIEHMYEVLGLDAAVARERTTDLLQREILVQRLVQHGWEDLPTICWDSVVHTVFDTL